MKKSFIQNRAMRIIFPGTSYSSKLAESGLQSLYKERSFLSDRLFSDISNSGDFTTVVLPRIFCYTEPLLI